MSAVLEIRDPQLAKDYLLETWAISRADKLNSLRLTEALRVALELASEGQPVPPLGFLGDLLHALGAGTLLESQEPAWSAPAIEPGLTRRYEDYVLGKFAADLSLERAADELKRYEKRDRDRALAFTIGQIQSRSQPPGALLSPASIKAVQSLSSTALQTAFYATVAHGVSSATLAVWDELIQSVRNCGELLGAEDIFELSSGTALSKFGQRLALRQVMQVAQQLSVALPKQKPAGANRHYAVATNILEEDLYPVGGFSSIGNRGTMESLLRSELAYMETDVRPDLFDIKYARDELLYYSRDENQFFRRRVTILFVFDADLAIARVKDAGASWQRIVLTMAIVVSMVRTLSDWLSSDALQFELLFPIDSAKLKLQDEWDVLQLIFGEEIRAGRLAMAEVDAKQLEARCTEHARQSLCHCIFINTRPKKDCQWPSLWQPLVSELLVGQSLPIVACDDQLIGFGEASEPWKEALGSLLRLVV